MCKIRKADFKYNRDPRVVNKRKKTKKKKKQRMPVNKKPPESPESASPAFSDTDVQITTNGDVSHTSPERPTWGQKWRGSLVNVVFNFNLSLELESYPEPI